MKAMKIGNGGPLKAHKREMRMSRFRMFLPNFGVNSTLKLIELILNNKFEPLKIFLSYK